MQGLHIEVKNGKWLINGKPFIELPATDRILLNKFFEFYKENIGMVNFRNRNLKKHNHQFKHKNATN